MAANIPSTSSQPYTTTFSFTAPYPPSPAPSAQAQSLAKQRRVSLALPSDSSPRIFPAWSFRDDTGLGVHSPDSPQDDDVEKKGGKMRKIANDDSLGADSDVHSCTQAGQPPPLQGPTPTNPDKPEKKPRKKWTMEETQMLVAGCNKVRNDSVSSESGGLTMRVLPWGIRSGASGTGSPSSTTLSSNSMDGRPSI